MFQWPSMRYEGDPGVQWMLAYQAGDEAAFDRLVEGYSGQLYALLTRFLGPVSEREDLLQEVFLRVIRARERYQPTARFSTWLYRITFNIAVNRTQRNPGTVSLEAPNDLGELGPLGRQAAPGDEPDRELERNDVIAAVRRAIDSLPASQRMALVLAKYEELPYAEIAMVMGSSEKAIKSMIHRARENMRARLAPYLQEEAT
ncbi:MAG TPA: sigma-70 family RNA polymerase sigma factor [Planctomycetota bacterium]|nr:sigma-70 family RNA polymerase sigma factor [Planctomycetota bacterium]